MACIWGGKGVLWRCSWVFPVQLLAQASRGASARASDVWSGEQLDQQSKSLLCIVAACSFWSLCCPTMLSAPKPTHRSSSPVTTLLFSLSFTLRPPKISLFFNFFSAWFLEPQWNFTVGRGHVCLGVYRIQSPCEVTRDKKTTSLCALSPFRRHHPSLHPSWEVLPLPSSHTHLLT